MSVSNTLFVNLHLTVFFFSAVFLSVDVNKKVFIRHLLSASRFCVT
jgi:hypothetical protein